MASFQRPAALKRHARTAPGATIREASSALVVAGELADYQDVLLALKSINSLSVDVARACSLAEATQALGDRHFDLAIFDGRTISASDLEIVSVASHRRGAVATVLLTAAGRTSWDHDTQNAITLHHMAWDDLSPSMFEFMIRAALRERDLRHRLKSVMAEFAAFAACHGPACRSQTSPQTAAAKAETNTPSGPAKSAVLPSDTMDTHVILETAQFTHRAPDRPS